MKELMTPMTFEELLTLDAQSWQVPKLESKPKVADRREFIDDQMHLCFSDPEAQLNSPAARFAGEWKFDHLLPQQRYWNDRFAVAIMCNLPLEKKRQAAWAMLCNGIGRYFEWKTSNGFRMTDVFCHLGIEFDEASLPGALENYCHLPDGVARQIAEMFDLPTQSIRGKDSLTAGEASLRRGLNGLHESFDLQ